MAHGDWHYAQSLLGLQEQQIVLAGCAPRMACRLLHQPLSGRSYLEVARDWGVAMARNNAAQDADGSTDILLNNIWINFHSFKRKFYRGRWKRTADLHWHEYVEDAVHGHSRVGLQEALVFEATWLGPPKHFLVSGSSILECFVHLSFEKGDQGKSMSLGWLLLWYQTKPND